MSLLYTDIDDHRFTAFATDTKRGQLADLELRHRRRARREDRIRCAKNTGLRNLPLKGFAQNQVIVFTMAPTILRWPTKPTPCRYMPDRMAMDGVER